MMTEKETSVYAQDIWKNVETYDARIFYRTSVRFQSESSSFSTSTYRLRTVNPYFGVLCVRNNTFLALQQCNLMRNRLLQLFIAKIKISLRIKKNFNFLFLKIYFSTNTWKCFPVPVLTMKFSHVRFGI